MKIENTSTSKYRWLIFGQIVSKDKEGNASQVGMNSILTTDENRIARKDLALAQQGLQMRFINQFGPEEGANIVDIPIVSISAMGATTDEEFHAGFSADNANQAPTHPAAKA